MRAWPALLLGLLAISGCASREVLDRRAPHPMDPWEGYNRYVSSFNRNFDEYIFLPVARTYHEIVPDPVETGIDNFFSNLAYPLRIVNSTLQGKFAEAGSGVARFGLNSFGGLLGFVDVATDAGFPAVEQDFGLTFGRWGWTESRYFVLPFLGPATIRDSLSLGIESYVAPPAYIARQENLYWPLALRLVNLRANLLDFQDDVDAAYDPYAFLRDAYLQRREYLVYEGDPPLPDYESMLED